MLNSRLLRLVSRRQLVFCLPTFLTAFICIIATPGLTLTPTTDTTIQRSQTTAATAESLQQQGRSLYQSGQFEQATVVFEQAAQAYARQGNLLQQAIALSNLSLSHQHLQQWTAAAQAITQSINLLKDIHLERETQQQALAQVLDIQGRLNLLQGEAQTALAVWEQAATLYQALGDRPAITQNLINQSQALQQLGFYRRATTTVAQALNWQPDFTNLETLETQLQALDSSSTSIAALQSLGEALRVTGNLAAARPVLEQSLEMAQQLQQPDAIATAQFKLANVAWLEALINLNRNNLTIAEAVALIEQARQGDRYLGTEAAEEFNAATDQVIQLYQQAATAETMRLSAQLNQLRVLVETARRTEVESRLPVVQERVNRLPDGQEAIKARINLAQSLLKWKNQEPGINEMAQEIAQLLQGAAQQANERNDPRAESYALGYLGKLYAQMGQAQPAQETTQQAIWLAQRHQAFDIAYRWEWQLGQLLKIEADRIDGEAETYKAAIAAYTEAIDTLKLIRNDLAAITTEEQLSFQETIEPIYRELVTLLLVSHAKAQNDSNNDGNNDENLRQAREVIELLQLAELDNFFREACLNGNPALIDQVDQSAAVLYPIILPEQLAVIVSLPQNTAASTAPQSQLHYFPIPVAQAELEETISSLRDSLDQSNESRFLQPAQQLYDWLIRPVQDQLEANSVETVVFVLDGALRNIPMSVLHDGQQYLVEKPYSIALTPGLQLLETQPLAQEQLQLALLAGMTEPRPGFSALPSVVEELAQIQAEIPDTTTLLDRGLSRNQELTVDRAFTSTNFQTAIATDPFPIVHLATHGQFSSRLEETYILTEDGRLTIADLRRSLQTIATRQDGVLALLVLSACETATGDDQAALGLAGMAVRAGARSTVATLWQVNDYSSAIFMGEFYRHLSNVQALQLTKADALQLAQRSLLASSDYQHPYFWAPYVLIGNWQ